MTNFNEQLKNETSQIRLSHDERVAMRARLAQEMQALRPVEGVVATPYRFYLSFQELSFVQRSLAAVLLLGLVAGSGAGSAYAAQEALPGEWLYPLKIYVTENVETALATSPSAKAQVHAVLAERRVEEAQTLAAQGKLTEATTQQLQTNFDEHANAAQSLTEVLATEDPGAAAQIGSQLSSSLAANDAVLVRLGDASVDPETKHNSYTLAQRVRLRAGEMARVNTRVLLSANVIAQRDDTKDAKGEDTSNQLPGARVSKRAASTTVAVSTLALVVATTSTSTTAVASTSAVAGAAAEEAATSSESHDRQDIALQLEGRARSEFVDAKEQFSNQATTLESDARAEVQAQLSSVSVWMSKGDTALGARDYDTAIANFNRALQKAVELQAYLRAGKNFNTKLVAPLLDID